MQRAQTHEVSDPCATLISLFELRVAAAPDATAYAFVRDDLTLSQQLTRRDLETRARALAAALCTHAEPGQAVLLVYPAGLEFVCAFWACVLAGLVPVPTTSIDASRLGSAVERLRAVAANAQARLVLCDRHTLTRVRQERLDDSLEATWLATDEALAEPTQLRAVAGQPADVAYLQYTSGSTTSPRGVKISHANLLANCAALSAVQEPDERSIALSWLPHFHDYGLVHGVVWPFFAGIVGHLMSPLTFLRRPLRWLDAIGRLGVTHSGAPNFAYDACTSALRDQPAWRGNLQGWRVASCGAEPIDAAVVQRFTEQFAPHGLRPEAFTPAYGLAEATLLVSAKKSDQLPTRLVVSRQALAAGRVCLQVPDAADDRVLVGCGGVVEGLSVQVVDPETHEVCAPGRVGELWISGNSIGQGYHGRHDDDDQVFGQRLIGSDSARWLRSGDLGFLHGDEVFVAGRLKDLLIVHGRNVYPQDVEWTMQRACPGLRTGHGAAFAIEGSAGEQTVVVQEVERGVPDGRLPAMAADIRRALATELELAVQRVVLVRPGSVPRTSSGKVQRGRCRDDYVRGRLAVRLEDSAAAAPLGADATRDLQPGVLQSLLHAAARISGHDAGALRADRSALENGLDSLQCFRLLEWAQREAGTTLPIDAVLGGESLAALAQRIDAPRQPETPAIIGATESAGDGATPSALTPQQRGVWFADRIADNAMYTLMQPTRIVGNLDLARLQRCLERLLQRHQALRLHVTEEDGKPRQHLRTGVQVPWNVIDLQRLAAAQREAELQQQVQKLARQRIDPSLAPLLRATLWRLGPHEQVLALQVHHLVFDGASAVVLMREWAALYQDEQAVVSLPRCAGYLRYAEWQRRWLDSPLAQAQQERLRAHLSAVPALDLPTDRPRPHRPSFNGSAVRFELAASRIEGLQALATRENATLFMVLMALFQVQMHRLTGQVDFAVGTPASARPAGTFEHTVGLFTNTLVLRASLSGDLSFAELLARVRRETLCAIEHEAVPLDCLAESMPGERDLRRNAFFQVGLALQSMGDTTLRIADTASEPLP
ncbi:MAG TPA: condensation domain-containing protein, partial [Burkholderiaceae bacterium]|nr:condensation domain-containing protein [Burkholderiaceae bacterium]